MSTAEIFPDAHSHVFLGEGHKDNERKTWVVIALCGFMMVRFFGATDRAATGAYQMRPFGRPMIETYFGGSLARDLQTAGKAAMIAFACEEIAAVLGTAIIARLRPLGVSSWAVDPLALGSYSHAEPGRANARSVLSTPIQNRIFFAGEACSIHDFSTAHGAYKTGVAAAEAYLAQNKSTAR